MHCETVVVIHIGKSKILRSFIASFVANPNIICIMNATNDYNRKHTNSRDRTNYRESIGMSITKIYRICANPICS